MRHVLLLLLSAVLLFAAGSAWIALYPAVPADLGGVENLDSKALHVKIPVGEDEHLNGWYLEGTQPATVILFAGYARDHRRVWRYAHFLHKLGFHIVTVDFRSARTLRRKPTTLGYWELRDARATLDWVRARPGLGRHPVALFGESLGGVVALQLAVERPDVAAVVADCPFASGDEAIADGLRLVTHVPAFPFAPLARQVGRLITGHDPGAVDATESLRALNGRPVLVIQTRVEDKFSQKQVERITHSLGLEGESWTLADVKHTEAWVNQPQDYEKRVGTFLRTRLGIPEPSPPSLAKRATRAARAGAGAVGRTVAKPFQKKDGR